MAFAYRAVHTVTSNSSLLPSTQTDFPVLVSITDTVLKSRANGGQVTSAVGNDIVFYSDVELTTALNYEVEYYNGTTGQIVAWVKIPSLALGSVFYSGIGNAAITTFQGNINGTWNTNFRGVWHLPDGTSLTAPDSTSGGNNGTITGATAVAGEIDGGAAFAAGTDIINFGSGVPDLTSSWTISGWFNRANGNATDRLGLFARWASTTLNRQVFIYFNGTGDGKINVDIPFIVAVLSSTTTFAPASGWNYYAVTKSGNNWSLFLNGSGTADATATNATAQETGSAPTIGNWLDNTGGLQAVVHGSLDETRISDVARPAAWLTAEYNNQANPTTFVGTQFVSNLGMVVRASQTRQVGPMVQRSSQRAKNPWSQFPVPADTNFILPTYPLHALLGPTVVRQYNRAKVTWVSTPLPSDTNFGFPVYPVNLGTGPVVMQRRRRPSGIPWVSPSSVTAVAYSLILTPGTYTVLGTAAITLALHSMGAVAGSYLISGASATLLALRRMGATAGTYTITGAAAPLLASRRLSGTAGAYAITGNVATLLALHRLSAGAGAYVVSGAGAGVVAQRVVRATSGAYTITGVNASLVVGRILRATPGTYVVTGDAVTILRSYKFPVTPGAYALTGDPTVARLHILGGFPGGGGGSTVIIIND